MQFTKCSPLATIHSHIRKDRLQHEAVACCTTLLNLPLCTHSFIAHCQSFIVHLDGAITLQWRVQVSTKLHGTYHSKSNPCRIMWRVSVYFKRMSHSYCSDVIINHELLYGQFWLSHLHLIVLLVLTLPIPNERSEMTTSHLQDFPILTCN